MTATCGSVWHWYTCTLTLGHGGDVCCHYRHGVLLAAWRKP